MQTRSVLRVGGAVAGAVLAALASAGIAQAIVEDEYRYSQPQVGWYSLSPQAFAPANMATTNNNYQILSNGILMFAAAGGCFVAGVNLPHGARIRALAVWYGSHASSGVTATLSRFHPGSGTDVAIASITSVDTGGARTPASIVPAAEFSSVDNQRYAYSLRVCLTTSNEVFYAGRIAYSYTTAGD